MLSLLQTLAQASSPVPCMTHCTVFCKLSFSLHLHLHVAASPLPSSMANLTTADPWGALSLPVPSSSLGYSPGLLLARSLMVFLPHPLQMSSCPHRSSHFPHLITNLPCALTSNSSYLPSFLQPVLASFFLFFGGDKAGGWGWVF